ncbi:MAG TPA: ATP-binding protein [Verrucomicrobiae bacterium]|nr:ATP-binding protein [Verrucomicrobiae bacterium]
MIEKFDVTPAQGDSSTMGSLGGDVADILDALDTPIFVVDRDCKIVSFNHAATDALGLNASDIGRLPSNIQRLSEFKDIEDLSIQVMSQEAPCRREVQYGERWFILRITPRTGSGGQIEGAILALTNVTAFRACIARAIYEREYTKTILNTVAQPLVVLDAGLRVQTGNRAFYTLFGVSREATNGTPLRNLGNHNWNALSLWSSLNNLLEDVEFKTVEIEADFPATDRRTFLIDAHRLPHDGEATILVGFLDITERKRMEETKDRLARHRQLALDAARLGWWHYDPKTKIASYDQRFTEIFGITGNQGPIGEILKCLHPCDLPMVWAKVEASLNPSDPKPYEVEYRINHPNGTVRWIEAYGSVEFEGQGDSRCAVSFVGTVADITERHEAEQKLAESFKREKAARETAEAAGRAKDDFLAALSHELRTPLNPVLLVASDAVENPDLPQDIRSQFKTILTNVEVEARLIDDLLDLTCLKNDKLKLDLRVVDAHAILREAAQVVQGDINAKRIHTVFNLNAEQHQILADSVRLNQIFWNVLKNAVKFTPENGKIVVETISISKTFRVTITDTGIGMTPEELERIFSAFSQGDHSKEKSARFGGLGLGLAISKKLVEFHSGRIWASSRGRVKGSTFTIEFSLA